MLVRVLGVAAVRTARAARDAEVGVLEVAGTL